MFLSKNYKMPKLKQNIMKDDKNDQFIMVKQYYQIAKTCFPKKVNIFKVNIIARIPQSRLKNISFNKT